VTTRSIDNAIKNTAHTCDQNPVGKLCSGVDFAAFRPLVVFLFAAITVLIIRPLSDAVDICYAYNCSIICNKMQCLWLLSNRELRFYHAAPRPLYQALV
jgi:hypothetical protein